MRQINKIFVESKDNKLEFKIPKHSRIIHIEYLNKYFNYNFDVIYEENFDPRYSEFDIITYYIKFKDDVIPDNLSYHKSFFDKEYYDTYIHLYKEI